MSTSFLRDGAVSRGPLDELALLANNVFVIWWRREFSCSCLVQPQWDKAERGLGAGGTI
jgi:hypothetical protein